MADLPSKMDKLLEILETVAEKERISVNALARKLHTKIASIRLYLDYLEELGLIYTEKDGRTTYVNIAADMVAKVGDTMIAVVNGKTLIWRCPFKEICPYYEKGCTTVDKCPFLQAMSEVDDTVKELLNYIEEGPPGNSESTTEDDQ